MSDREKIVKGLEYCIEAEDEACPEECPFYKKCLTDDRPFYPVIRAALELLKEQEPVKPIRLENWWKCTSCGGNIVANMKYCPRCGRSVKWE